MSGAFHSVTNVVAAPAKAVYEKVAKPVYQKAIRPVVTAAVHETEELYSHAQQLERAGFGLLKNTAEAAGKGVHAAGDVADSIGNFAKYVPYVLVGGGLLVAVWMFRNPDVVKEGAKAAAR